MGVSWRIGSRQELRVSLWVFQTHAPQVQTSRCVCAPRRKKLRSAAAEPRSFQLNQPSGTFVPTSSALRGLDGRRPCRYFPSHGLDHEHFCWLWLLIWKMIDIWKRSQCFIRRSVSHTVLLITCRASSFLFSAPPPRPRMWLPIPLKLRAYRKKKPRTGEHWMLWTGPLVLRPSSVHVVHVVAGSGRLCSPPVIPVMTAKTWQLRETNQGEKMAEEHPVILALHPSLPKYDLGPASLVSGRLLLQLTEISSPHVKSSKHPCFRRNVRFT